MIPCRLAAALGLAVVLAVLPARAPAADGRVDFPLPELTVTIVPLSLSMARPSLEPPAPPPLPAPAAEFGAPPLPRFATAVVKPYPPARDPGGTACTFHFGRPAALAECGVHRALQGDLAGARSALDESVAREPLGAQAPLAYVWLGEIAFREGRADEAERRYRAALSANPPTDLAAHAALALGWLALRRGDLAEGSRVLARARAGAPPPLVAQIARFLDAVARLLGGQPAEALALWNAIAGSGPPPEMAEELLFWRAVTQGRLGQSDVALAALDGFLRTVPASHPLRAEAIVQSGWMALERGAADDALRRFLWAQASSPRGDLVPQIRAGLARAYVALGDPVRAQDTARLLAVEAPRDPVLPRVLLLIAEDALGRQATAQAVDTLRQLLGLGAAVDSRVAEYATYRLAEGLERLNNAAEAERHYRALREKGRVERIAQRAVYHLGLLALRAGRPAGARAEGEALLQAGVLEELREPVLLLTAEGAARGDDANRAAALFRLFLRDYPASARAAAARLALGWALVKDGEPESALREWEEARLAADVEVAVLAQLAIADVALRQGHEDQSLAALTALAKLAPSHPLADILALNRGVLLVRARAWEPAVRVLEPLAVKVAARPDRPTLEPILRRALGLARYRLQQFDVAEREFAWARHWAPAEFSNSLAEGLAALAGGRPVDAEKPLGIARFAPVPDVAIPAAYGLVVAAVRRNDDQLFGERATGFVDRYPGHSSAPLILYEAVRRATARRDLDGADAWLTRLLGAAPTSEYVQHALVMVGGAAARERPALARRAWGELLARTQDRALRGDAWLGLAEAGLALGDTAETQRALEGFLRETGSGDARAPRALALLIDAQEALGRRPQAIEAAERFLRLFPAHDLAPNIQLRLGHYLLVDQRWDDAKTALEAARDAGEPTVAAPAQFYLGELFRSRGEHEAAIAAYLGASYLYPDQPPWAARGLQGAVQSYLARQMPREASILLRKLLSRPGVEPDVTRWARDRLARLGPITGEDPSAVLRKGAAR